MRSSTIHAGRAVQGRDYRYDLLSQTAPAPRMELIRVAMIAAETGARFVRECVPANPTDWLLAPRVLFDGRPAIDACGSAEGFRRALVLHGLSLGLDASPSLVSGIPGSLFLSEADCEFSLASRPPERGQGDSGKCGDPELYTCTISALVGDQHVQVFAAMIASGHVEVRSRLRRRYGPLLEDEAIVRAGFDWSEPLACAMVSDAMAHVLEMAAEEPSSPIAAGLDFQIEQRFAA